MQRPSCVVFCDTRQVQRMPKNAFSPPHVVDGGSVGGVFQFGVEALRLHRKTNEDGDDVSEQGFVLLHEGNRICHGQSGSGSPGEVDVSGRNGGVAVLAMLEEFRGRGSVSSVGREAAGELRVASGGERHANAARVVKIGGAQSEKAGGG